MTPDNTPASVAVAQLRDEFCRTLEASAPGRDPDTGIPFGPDVESIADALIAVAQRHRLAFQQPGGEGREHWSRQTIVSRIVKAQVGGVKAVEAGKAADDILALLAPCFAPRPAPDAALRSALSDIREMAEVAEHETGNPDFTPIRERAEAALAVTPSQKQGEGL